MKQPYLCPNKANGYIWLTDEQFECVQNRLFIESGLSINDYLSLIDPDYINIH